MTADLLPEPDMTQVRVDVYRGGGTVVRVTWIGPGVNHTVAVDADGIGTICARERALGALAARLAADDDRPTPTFTASDPRTWTAGERATYAVGYDDGDTGRGRRDPRPPTLGTDPATCPAHSQPEPCPDCAAVLTQGF